jgi:tetratricopeptide (TPR) repeat protein
MQHADSAPPDLDALGGGVTLLAEIVADPRPPTRLLAALRAFAAAGDANAAVRGVALFESIHYRLPAFADDELPGVASALYDRAGNFAMALLLAGLAVQLRPRDTPAQEALRALEARHPELLPDPDEDVAARIEAVARHPDPGAVLLLALEALDTEEGRPASITLFEAIWPRVRPMTEYWVYHRMAQVYASAGRADASGLLASLAIQIQPFGRASDMAFRLLLRVFRATGRSRDAAELCLRRLDLCPEQPLLSEAELAALLAEAGPLHLSPPAAGRADAPLLAAEEKPARQWRCYGAGVPLCLHEMQRPMVREPITMSELHDAEVWIDNGGVAVFGPDGAPHIDLSVRCFPPLLRRQLLAESAGANPPELVETEAAVLISDIWPGPNLCHFLLDHITRLELYRRAGVDPANVTVIGPELRDEFQRIAAARMGVQAYLPVTKRTRLRAARLWVSSNCHSLRHPAHWGAEWAVRAVRDCFDLAPRRPPRRLLISRRDSQFRRIRNEGQLADLLEPLGFEVVTPGLLSFEQQIATFRDATHVVAPHGAGLTNILWCAPGTHVLEVFHPHYGTWAYAMLKDVLDLDYATLVARDADSASPAFNDPSLPREQRVPHAGRDMWVDPDELERWLVESGVW